MDSLLPIRAQDSATLGREIADRFNRLRLDHLNWSRERLAEKSGVTASTIKRFEHTGQITLVNLIALATAMDAADAFENLFEFPEIQSLADLEKRQRAKRQRGRSK